MIKHARWLVLAGLLGSSLGSGPSPASSADDPAQYTPLVDAVEEELVEELSGTLPTYEIAAELRPATATGAATLTGTMGLDYVNATGAEQGTLYLRLYPNNPEYGTGGMEVTALEVDGEPAEPVLSEDDTVLSVELAEPLAEDGTLRVEAAFETTVPSDLRRSYGMFKYDSELEIYSLAHWFPMLAGLDPEGDWEIGPLSQNGDPVFSNTALFDVALTLPEEFELATSGSLTRERTGAAGSGTTTHRLASGPSRDFVMAASPAFEVVEEMAGDTLVRSFAAPGYEEGNARVLTYAVQSLDVFNRLFGAYPYEELDLVQVGLGGGAGGVEFPGILYIGADYYEGGEDYQGIPAFLEFIVAHEVGHQWWYGVVGNDQYEHAYLDEALTNYVTTVYFAEQYGEAAGVEQVNYQLELGYLNLLFEGGDDIVDQPTDDFASQSLYGPIVYGKGALGFLALREEIGDDAFFAALRAYYVEHAFDVATPEDLQRAFEEASGDDLDAFWDHWFRSAEGDDDFDATDLADLLIEIGIEP